MGQLASCCGEDIFKKLLTEYGDDFMKLILAEKAKDVIKQKFRDLNVESDNMFNEFSSHVNTIVDQKLQSLNRTFESAKSSVQKYIPGGISTLQRMKGQSINQFSGYNKLQSKIDSVRDNTLQKVGSKKQQVIGDLNGKQGQMIQVVQAERPKVPIYQQLPQGLRRDILKKGQTQFKEQIQKNKESIIKRLLTQFLPQSFNMIGPFLSQMNPENPLASLLQNAFGELTGNITSVSGGRSGFIDNVKKIF